jgi:dipeptidyl aminopeptidase/acylaminoacyl peptidase
MTHPTTAPYGTWRSPISADLIAGASVSFSQLVPDGQTLYWVEVRPAEQGRAVIVRCTADGTVMDVTPPGFHARTRVHEYGGLCYAVQSGTVFFSNYTDQRLYRQDPGQAPRPITPETALRYADPVIDPARNRLICVREDHTGAGEPINTIVAVDLDGQREQQVLASGNDFYAAPRISRDGRFLAWLTWNHPNMPWDAAELWVAPLDESGLPGAAQQIAGGPGDAAFQPEWADDGALIFMAERSGWWNPYRYHDGTVVPLAPTPLEEELGLPLWNFGVRSYTLFKSGAAVAVSASRPSTLLQFRAAEAGPAELSLPWWTINWLQSQGDELVFIGAAPHIPPQIVRYNPIHRSHTVLMRSPAPQIDPEYISLPDQISFPTSEGREAYANFYAPRNRDFSGPEGELPPLVTMCHGGPTANSPASFSLKIQYWTSRGFAVVDVNYGGSTGFGRAYRERLEGNWGIVDVDDCCNCARYLAEQGRVDGDRMAITGGSAGGFTTLASLTFRQVFKAGASHFGVSDLEALARDTHKFEARYLDRLVGPYPERRDLYLERSPIAHTELLNCPIIFFQGLEDVVVPPDQSERMATALRYRKLPVAYLPFEGEQHGFRKAGSIKRALEAEAFFYSRIFGFDLADPVEPVEIENL